MADHFTFAVIGHNEERTVANALRQAFEARQPGDDVWFIDSASTDGSARIAESFGAVVVAAPLGKGRAMTAAMERCDDGYMCFVDADLERSEMNIPRRVHEVTRETGADMVVGSFHEPDRRMATTPGLYRPLMDALFPEHGEEYGYPLSGFRALRVGLPIRPFPPGYGVETHLNIEVPAARGRTVDCDVGLFKGNLRDYANIPPMGCDIASAILDLAEAHSRLARRCRPAWDAWVDDVVNVLRSRPPIGADDSAFVSDLLMTAARPLPPAHWARPSARG